MWQWKKRTYINTAILKDYINRSMFENFLIARIFARSLKSINSRFTKMYWVQNLAYTLLNFKKLKSFYNYDIISFNSNHNLWIPNLLTTLPNVTKSYQFSKILYTRKYPLRGYILGVLTHTTAWDRHWGGDITLE